MEEELVKEPPLADKQRIGRKESQARLEQKIADDDLRWVLSTEQGRRFIKRLELKCGERRSSMMGNEWTNFYEGERNIYLWLRTEMERVAPQAVVTMINETLKKMVRESNEIAEQQI